MEPASHHPQIVLANFVAQKSVMNLSFSTAWGGLEMSTVKMTRLFHEAGDRSIGICGPGTPIAKAFGEAGLTHFTIENRDYFCPSATLRLRRLVKEHGVHAIFLHSLKDLWLVTPALVGLPEVQLFGFARMFLNNVNKRDPMHRLIYARLEHLIALSQAQMKNLLPCLPVPAEKYVVIPNGVDVDRFRPRARRDDIRGQWGFSPGDFVFGLIGRLDRQKGSLEFVEAAAHIIRQHPQARFVMVGGNTVGEAQIDREIRDRLDREALLRHVVLTDFRSDIPDVMNALDAFVMPSYQENFANVMLEAIASGLPCIGTNSGGTPEILDNGVIGLLCEPRSSDSLADCMRALIDDVELSVVLKARARRKAERVYDIRRVFDQIRSLVR